MKIYFVAIIFFDIKNNFWGEKIMKLPQNQISMQAMFRFGVVSKVKLRLERGESISSAIALCAKEYHLNSAKNKSLKISERTIYRWYRRYSDKNIVGLESEKKDFNSRSSNLSPNFVEFIKIEKSNDPFASIPEIINRARVRQIILTQDKICRTTVYRLCKKLELPIARTHNLRIRDMRRFSYSHRMQLVMCDGKHFKVGLNSTKRVALFFMDDATRMILAVVVGTSESTELFLKGLNKVIISFGLPAIIYVDKGPGFISNDSAKVIARLGSSLVIGTAGYPEARGKIEKFNQTAKNDLLRYLDGRIDVDCSCEALEIRLNHYIKEIYNKRPHESLKKETPYNRFFSDTRPFTKIIDQNIYEKSFVISESRRVSKDNIVSISSMKYEIPTGHALTYITIYRHTLEDRITMFHEGKLVDIKPVDLASNAHHQRAKLNSDDSSNIQLPSSAAELLFKKDFSPIVDTDGNFFNKNEE
jgi:putative transposase